jgi:uncharacterized repeat protein (TIGR01451 family)
MRLRHKLSGALVVTAFVSSLLVASPLAPPAAAAAGFPGTSADCEIDGTAIAAELIEAGLVAGGPIGAAIGGLAAGIADYFLSELGWTWVDFAHPMQNLTGVVEEKSHVSYTDLPMAHDSHDQNFDVLPDPQYDYLMSDANLQDEDGHMEIEWEVNDFPEWAWPNIGDRVWVNGNWILDCSHKGGATGHHSAEIHPPRAIASIRDQVHTLPGTGTTPVAVKATDLYIHGEGGYATTVEECGVNSVILLHKFDSCTPRPGIAEDYDFDIPLGAAPNATAVPSWSYEDGPGNGLAPDPVLTFVPATSSVHVHVPLAGSGAVNSDVYARKIFAGWVSPPTNLHLYHARLVQGTLHEDMDLDPGDCECESFRMSVNRATDQETYHLDGYDDPTDLSDSIFCPGDNTLDDWDDDGGLCGHGRLNFHGPDFDFYLADGQDVTFQFSAYDSDCWDDTYGSPHSLEINGLEMGICYLNIINDIALDGPDNDPLGDATGTFDSSNILNGGQDLNIHNGNYSMKVRVTEDPLTAEANADLAVAKSCTPTTVNAATPFSCRVELTNGGPGLPTGVQLTDTINTTIPSSEYSIGSPTLSWENVAGSPAPVSCPVAANVITCDVGTVPLGGAKAVLTYSVTSNEGGTIGDTAAVTSTSTDPTSTNDSASASVTVIPQADLSIAKTAAPSPVLAGGTLTYTVTVTNNGPSSAQNVKITDTLPGVTLFKSATPSTGGSCTAPAVDASGSVVCTWSGATARNGTRSVVIVVEVPGPQTIPNIATASSPTEDPDATNNSVTVSTQIICTITGTPRNDTLVGTPGFDVICGLGGNDSIKANDGDDRVFGGAGNDSIQGDRGNDVLHGEDGDDSIQGNDGNDRLFGEAGQDILLGNDGDDTLNGGAGTKDVCVDRPPFLPPTYVNCEKASPS